MKPENRGWDRGISAYSLRYFTTAIRRSTKDKRKILKKYNRHFRELLDILNRWDAYGLIEGGAPKDEFANEGIKILSGINRCKTEKVVAQLIASIFGASFDKGDFSPENCLKVASEVFRWYNLNREA